MLKTIKNIVRLVLKNFSFLLILFVLFANSVLRAEDAEKKFIGFIDSLEGSVNKGNDDDLIKLAQFDQIFTNDKIKIDLDSLVTISFVDNSILTLEGDSEFFVEKFDNLSEEQEFIIAIIKGKFSFESGTIAKSDKGMMKIKLSEMEVVLKGTLVTGNNSDEGKKISLVKDSMGSIGELNITVDGQTTTITEEAAGLNLSGDNQIESITLSEEEKNEVMNTMSAAAVQASTQSAEKIERAITKKLAEGTIPDANGDGVADLKDVEVFKAGLLDMKEAKLAYIVEESKENLSILSEIIVNSDSSQSLELMEELMETNADNATLLMSEIAEKDFDIFSHVATAETGNFETLRETIVNEMIEDQSEFATDTMAQMMKVSDTETGSYLVNEITNIEPTDIGENLSMNVLASFTEIASEKMTELYQQDPTMMVVLTNSAFENATEQDIGMMSTMMQNSTGGNTAMLMQSMVEYNPEMVGDVYNDLAEQDYDLFYHIETARMEMERYDPYMDPGFDPSPEDPYYDPGATAYDPFMDPGFDPSPEDPYYDPGATAYDPFMDPGFDPSPMDPYYDPVMAFIDDLKGEIFSEIINHSEETSSVAATDMMMKAGGSSAMYMMESMMEDSPELVTQVMDNFMYQEFDIFSHMAEPTYDPYMDPGFDPSPEDPYYDPGYSFYDPGATAADPFMDPGFDPNPMDPYYDPVMMDVMYELQSDIIGTMMDYGGEESMETMAYMMSTGDATNSAFILEAVMEHTYDPYMDPDFDPYSGDPYYDPYAETAEDEENLALALLDEMAEIDPDMMGEIYEQQEDLMEDIFEEAFENASEDDASMIADIMASEYASEDMAEMMFDHLANMDVDQSFMTEIFYDIAEQSPENLIAMAEMEQALYETMAYDPYGYDGGMSAGDLMEDIMTSVGYDPGYSYYDPGYSYYDPGYSYYEEDYYDPYYADYDPGYSEYDPGYSEYDPYYAEYEMEYDPYYSEYDPYYAEYDPGYSEYDPYYAEYEEEEEEDRWVEEEEEETEEYIPPEEAPYWNYMFTDSMYQDSMYDGTNSVRGTFDASNTTTSDADYTRDIYTELPFSSGTAETTVAQVPGNELPDGLNIIKPDGYDHVEIYGTLPTVSELTEYNFELELTNSAGSVTQEFTFYVDADGVTRVSWRDPTSYNDNISAKYFSYNEPVDITFAASTTNTVGQVADTVLFVSTPNPPLSWLSLSAKEETIQTWNSYYNQYEYTTEIVDDKASLTGTTPDDLAVYTDFTFDVRAYEASADLATITTAQYNDRQFVYQVAANPDCVSPANENCPP